MIKKTKLNRIKIVLVEKGVTNRDLAKMLEVNELSVSRWATNRQQPSLVKLYKIAKVLEVDICELLNREYSEDEKE